MSMEMAKSDSEERPWREMRAPNSGSIGVHVTHGDRTMSVGMSGPPRSDSNWFDFDETRLTMNGQTLRTDVSVSHYEFASQNGSGSFLIEQQGSSSRVDDNALKPAPHTIREQQQQHLQQQATIDWSSVYQQPVPETNTTTVVYETFESHLLSDVITTQPTLLPRTSNRDRHDLPLTEFDSSFGERSTVNTCTLSDQSTAFTLEGAVPNGSLHLRTNANVGEPSTVSNGNSAEELSRLTMGYTTNSGNPSAWSVTENAWEKMMDVTSDPAERSEGGFHTNEGKNHEDDDTTVQSFDSTTVGSPAIAPLNAHDVPPESATEGQPIAIVETPSTVSTSASTDEASQGDVYSFERSLLRGDVNAGEPAFLQHRRAPSWEASPRQSQQFFIPDHEQAFGISHALPPAYAPQPSPWGHQMVTSFRGEHEVDRQSQFPYNPLSPTENRWHLSQQQPPQQIPRFAPPQLPFLPGRGTPPVDNRMHRSPQTGFNSFPAANQRKPTNYAQPALPPAIATPPRSTAPGRGQQRLPLTPSPHRQPPSTFGLTGLSSGSSRSSSEILKTLLRKKACLYEPDTSRAVALVTWLVGRELALEHGFFSRQQLQAGVHTCVSEKINSGSITRTKVNRCMQIILNSCFHYIIPRPDGTEEKGDLFRSQFAKEAEEDSFLLRMLPDPWSDVVVDKAEILRVSASEAEEKPSKNALETPQSSPRLGSLTPEKGSPGREAWDEDDAHKRAVLLCFNENVRRAEDVFRCHNEFIRDTAHASHLQLSSQEWRIFFGPEAAVASYIWGNIGIPVPYSEVHGSSHVDALGMMTTYEAAKFRTSWCTKRYDHDHDLCGFAHAEVNGGWLRRSPPIHQYRDEMCPSITTIADKQAGQKLFVINECPHGVNCEYAHSLEEIIYHPRRYKMNTCPSAGRSGGCNLGDVCPSFHPVDSYRFPKKSDSRSSRHSRHIAHQASGAKGSTGPPAGSPLLLASPAPMSSFEEHLLLPGLQDLFRRQCSVVRAHLRKSGCTCYYSYFGDDAGSNAHVSVSQPPRGLPTART